MYHNGYPVYPMPYFSMPYGMPMYNAYAAPSQPRPITAMPAPTQIAPPLALTPTAAIQPMAVQPTMPPPQPIALRPLAPPQYTEPYQGMNNEEYNRGFPEQPENQNAVSGYEGDDGEDDGQAGDDGDYDDRQPMPMSQPTAFGYGDNHLASSLVDDAPGYYPRFARRYPRQFYRG